MSLDEKFAPVRTMLYDMVGNSFQKIASLFGYPNNPGMPIVPDLKNEIFFKDLKRLPLHTTSWSTQPAAETWFEIIFGAVPKLETIDKYNYENSKEGFYNFYIENYKNLFFLPDWFSKFLQVKLNICLNTTILENIREVLFVGLIVYSQIITLRLILYWFIVLNPYVFPWCYLSALVDWTEDVLQGIVPSIFGINLAGSLFLGTLGILADSLNHLVFTMPFLPSEGEEGKVLINEQIKDVLIFHYLPVLWYRYSIPNEIREFWYEKRPDILSYMRKTYKHLNIDFLPNIEGEDIYTKLVREISLTMNQKTLETTIPNYSSTEILSNATFTLLHINNPLMEINYINQITEQFHSLSMIHI